MESYSDDTDDDISATRKKIAEGRFKAPVFQHHPEAPVGMPPQMPIRPPLENLIYNRGTEYLPSESLSDTDEDEDDKEDEVQTIVTADNAPEIDDQTAYEVPSAFDKLLEDAGLAEAAAPPPAEQGDENIPDAPVSPDDASTPPRPAPMPAYEHAPGDIDNTEPVPAPGYSDEYNGAYPSAGPSPDTLLAPAPPPAPGSMPPGSLPPTHAPDIRAAYSPDGGGAYLNAYNAPPPPRVEVVPDPDAAYYAEKLGLRRGLVAGFITGYLLKRYLANKKMERYRKATEKELGKQQEELTTMTGEQQKMADELRRQRDAVERARLEALTKKPDVIQAPVSTPEKSLADKWFPERQPVERVSQSAWHNVIVDEHGREIQGAITYGQGFKQEQHPEQAGTVYVDYQADRPRQVQPVAAQGASGVPMAARAWGTSSPPPQDNSSLPLGHPLRQDSQTSTTIPTNPIKDTLANPWVWLMFGILIAAFFIAAFI